ncbi:MAG: hypothetical protein N2504_00540 [candidate division WOR-3 bacterium]|nr:hypothetical protein [candidate division WOR-3 bacterium]MCX7947061.1 hypothetical protein [candidate division WOR-3 bacterium]MDW8149898.1 hypothetical protein [candidate division WOR-3 bacterium]
MNNYIYRLYIELLSERGYMELEEFVEFLKLQLDEFFEIVYQNILEGIYTKSNELGLNDMEIEELSRKEYERIQHLKSLLKKSTK